MKAVRRLAGSSLLGWLVACLLLTAIIPYEALATPMVAITQPANGAVVRAEVWVDVVYQSSTNDPVARLELLVDGAVVRKYVLPAPRLKGEASFSYNFRTQAGQLHRLSVRAVDTTGAVGEASINVQVRKVVAPPQRDETPPVVNIYYPHEGQRVSGVCEIKVDARDNVGVEWVFVYLDGKIKAMIKGNPPYTDRWDTTKATDGEHVIQAKAWDAAENEGSSAPVRVTVANRERTVPLSKPPEPVGPTLPRAVAAVPRPVEPPSRVRPSAKPSAPPRPAPAAPAATSPARTASAPVLGPTTQVRSAAPVSSISLRRPQRLAVSTPANRPAPRSVVSRGEVGATSAQLPAKISCVAPSVRLAARTDVPGRVTGLVAGAATAKPAVGVPRTSASAWTLARMPEAPGSLVAIAYRIASPAAGVPRILMPAALQASWPQPRAVSGSARPRPGTTSALPRRNGLPSRPPVLSGTRPDVNTSPGRAPAEPAALRAAARWSRMGHPARHRPAGSPAPTGQGIGSAARRPELQLAPRAAEVYLLAMLPQGPGHPAGGQKSSVPGRAARKPGLVNISPAALSRFEEVKIVYDGKLVPLRACPEVKCGIPVGPLREVFEQCDGVLYWFPVQKRVKAVRPGLTVELRIGVPTVKVNNGTEELELAPYIRRGRTMVPLSFLARTLNLTITFDSRRGQLIISRNDL